MELTRMTNQPAPERCPTCGSENKAIFIYDIHALGFSCSEKLHHHWHDSAVASVPVPQIEKCPRCESTTKEAYWLTRGKGCTKEDHHKWHDFVVVETVPVPRTQVGQTKDGVRFRRAEEHKSEVAVETVPVVQPVPMQLVCPQCGTPHIDEGEWATRPHKTHQCQNPKCKLEWRPFPYATVGVVQREHSLGKTFAEWVKSAKPVPQREEPEYFIKKHVRLLVNPHLHAEIAQVAREYNDAVSKESAPPDEKELRAKIIEEIINDPGTQVFGRSATELLQALHEYDDRNYKSRGAVTANFVSEVHPRPDDPSCHVCGEQMVPNGFKCLSCGTTTEPEAAATSHIHTRNCWDDGGTVLTCPYANTKEVAPNCPVCGCSMQELKSVWPLRVFSCGNAMCKKPVENSGAGQ